jgi:hypothetical protein
MTVMLRSLERVGPAALLGLCLALSTRASAHHSFAMYDQTKLVTLEGTVKEFQWTNPHVLLWVTRAAEGGGEPELWTIELPTSTGNLARMNWSKRSLTPGDHVTVELNPLRDGRHGGGQQCGADGQPTQRRRRCAEGQRRCEPGRRSFGSAGGGVCREAERGLCVRDAAAE